MTLEPNSKLSIIATNGTKSVWDSGCDYGTEGLGFLLVKNNGNVIIYGGDGTRIWSTMTTDGKYPAQTVDFKGTGKCYGATAPAVAPTDAPVADVVPVDSSAPTEAATTGDDKPSEVTALEGEETPTGEISTDETSTDETATTGDESPTEAVVTDGTSTDETSGDETPTEVAAAEGGEAVTEESVVSAE